MRRLSAFRVGAHRDESMNIDPILRSVVAVRSSIPEDAFTAETLGTVREGSGVVIRDNGLVLTIGYLITEAEEVWNLSTKRSDQS
jgi:S1-C subfamily serine protease